MTFVNVKKINLKEKIFLKWHKSLKYERRTFLSIIRSIHNIFDYFQQFSNAGKFFSRTFQSHLVYVAKLSPYIIPKLVAAERSTQKKTS